MTSHRSAAALAALLLTAAGPALPLAPGRSLSIQATLDAPVASSPTLSLATSCWLDGDVEAVARLALQTAPDPQVRAAAVSLRPSIGLRWAPDTGRWRPMAGAEVGVGLRSGGHAASAMGAARAGVEWLPARDLGLAAGLGLRWMAGRGAAAEMALEGTLYF